MKKPLSAILLLLSAMSADSLASNAWYEGPEVLPSRRKKAKRTDTTKAKYFDGNVELRVAPGKYYINCNGYILLAEIPENI